MVTIQLFSTITSITLSAAAVREASKMFPSTQSKNFLMNLIVIVDCYCIMYNVCLHKVEFGCD